MSDWLQLHLPAAAEEAEALSTLLEGLGAVSVTYMDATDTPILEPGPGQTPLWAELTVTGLFPANQHAETLRARLASQLGASRAAAARIEPLADRDWTRAWMDGYAPMQFGERLWVCPSGFEPPDPEAINLWLDPGLAFGSGTHPTTALCLQWLDGAELTGKRVVDYGCGSGILAIAAARLGAAEVIAVDIDPQAIDATRDNAERNGVAAQITAGLPEILDGAEPADILLANILANPLIELAPQLTALTRPGGDIVLAGLLNDQADAVAAAFADAFTMDPPLPREDWSRLHGVRRRRAP